MTTVAGIEVEPPKDKKKLSLFDSAIKTFTSTVKKAKQAGVADTFINRTIRSLSPKNIAKKEKELMNKIADVKTTKKGGEYVKDRPGGAGRFVTKKEAAKERAKARTAVYGGTPVAGGSAVELSRAGKPKKDSKRTQEQFKKDYKNRLTPDQVRKALNKGKDKGKIISSASADSGTTKKDKSKTKTTTEVTGKKRRVGKFAPRFRPFGGALAKVLLGEDEQFGGEKGGLFDPNLGLGLRRSGRKVVTKKNGKVVSEERLNPEVSRKKDRKDPKKKNMGGMMKAKGKANGGAMKKKGYAAGGSANLKKAGAGQKGLKKLPTAVRNKMGYMKDGGMAKKGYAKGGAATKVKRTSKRKSSMGAATRGGGAIMR